MPFEKKPFSTSPAGDSHPSAALFSYLPYELLGLIFSFLPPDIVWLLRTQGSNCYQAACQRFFTWFLELFPKTDITSQTELYKVLRGTERKVLSNVKHLPKLVDSAKVQFVGLEEEGEGEGDVDWFEVMWNMMCVVACEEFDVSRGLKRREIVVDAEELRDFCNEYVDFTDLNHQLERVITRVVKKPDPNSSDKFITLCGLHYERRQLARIASYVMDWNDFWCGGDGAELLEDVLFQGVYFQSTDYDERTEQELLALLFSSCWGLYGSILHSLVTDYSLSMPDVYRHLYHCYGYGHHMLGCGDIITILKELIDINPDSLEPEPAEIRDNCLQMLNHIRDYSTAENRSLYLYYKLGSGIVAEGYETFFEKDLGKVLEFLESLGETKNMTKDYLHVLLNKNLNKKEMEAFFYKIRILPSTFVEYFHLQIRWPHDRILNLMNTYPHFGRPNYTVQVLDGVFRETPRHQFDDFAISFTNLRPKDVVETAVQNFKHAYEFLLAIATTTSHPVSEAVPAPMVAHLLRLVYPPLHESAETACKILFHDNMPLDRLQSILLPYIDFDPKLLGFLLSRVKWWNSSQIASLMLTLHTTDPRVRIPEVFPIFPTFRSTRVVAEYVAEFVKSDRGLLVVPSLIAGHYDPLEKYVGTVKEIVGFVSKKEGCQERMKAVEKLLGLIEPKVLL